MCAVVTGGVLVNGETVGILMLDTDFPRLHGDVGNARTFEFPVHFHVVPGATTDEVVADADRARALLPAFIEGARALEAKGVKAITTSCGFLSVVQAELAASVRVPVITSSLYLVPLVRTMVGARPLGIVTANAGHLSPAHLEACGIAPGWDVVVRGMDASPAFSGAILGGKGSPPTLDVDAVRAEVVAVCKALADDVPDLGAIVFECTNLQPYAAAVQAQVDVPIYGILQAIEMLHRGARAPHYDGTL